MTLVNLKECYRKQRCAEISTTVHDLSLISKVQDEKKSTLLAFPFFFPLQVSSFLSRVFNIFI